MRIVFWSPLHGCGTTAAAIAVSHMMATDYLQRLLIVQTHFAMNNLQQSLLGEKNTRAYLKGFGIDELIKSFKGSQMTAELIRRCSIKLDSGIELLPGTAIGSRELYEGRLSRTVFSRLFQLSGEFYDQVVIDANAGECINSQDAIEAADIVIAVIRQSPAMLEHLRETPLLKGKRVFYLFSEYDASSRYSLMNMKHLFAELNSSNSAGLIYSTGFKDSIESGRVEDFFFNAREIGKGRMGSFYENVGKVTSKILMFGLSTKGV